MQQLLGILGAGRMAEAIVRGVLKAGIFQASQILAADPSTPRREVFEKELAVQTIQDNQAVAQRCQTLILSVKPYQIEEALHGLGAVMAENTLLISILAGITSRSIEKHLGSQKKWRVVRAMPNTPMQVGLGMIAIAPGTHATPADLKIAQEIFQSAGQVVQVTEDKIDAVTALSGSGPAYFYYLVEQMIAAGIQMGLTPQEARLLAVQTAQGAGKLLADSTEPPAELRRAVTTPGGTTAAAISSMEKDEVGSAIIKALLAARDRARELAK